jgi:sugar phosphate isomerase/epimerase
MRAFTKLNRRRFVRTGLLGSAALSLCNARSVPPGADSGAEHDQDHGLKLGLTSYTLRKFSLEQAIAMTKEAGLRYISLKDMHLPMKSTQAERQEARKKVESAGLVLMGGGVIYMKNKEDEIRDAFEYAKDAGMPTIICSPELEALDTVEKFAKKYDVRIAIHNHGPGDQHYPSPNDVLALVKGRDSRMGLCIDIGHTIRLGEDPAAAIEKSASRLYDLHMKDVSEATAKGQPAEVGKGVIDIPGVLKALIRVKYPYHVALEYEAHADDPMPGVKGSIAYIRRVLAGIPQVR